MIPDTTPPDALLAEVARDLHAVRPAPTQWRQALGVTPVALAIVATLAALRGFFRDETALGPLLAWGVSLVETGMGIVLIWIATREGTPARRLSRNTVRSAMAVAGLMVITFTYLTFWVRPTAPPIGGAAWRFGIFCYVGGSLASVPIFAFAERFSSRWIAPNPALVGALFGAGAGLTANAGWRLMCPISAPWHVLMAHGGATISTTLLGAAVAYVVARRTRWLHGNSL